MVRYDMMWNDMIRYDDTIWWYDMYRYREYGEEWHKAGCCANKQNVFDDFCAAAEYLVKENYTKSSRWILCDI
mgnify:CR=1 FL=1